MNDKNATFCDSWSGLTMDDTVSYINSILLAAVNSPCTIFAFLSNPGAPNDNFRKNICSEDDLRSRIFETFVVKLLAWLPLLGFSNI